MHTGLHLVNLEDNTCPNREKRIGSIKAYHGTVSQLLKEHEKGGLEWRNRAFQQASWCVFSQAAGRMISVRDGVLLIHAPIGCSVSLNGYREIYKNIPQQAIGQGDIDLHVVSTNLTEKDIVYGGEEKLKESIREVDKRYKPRSIFVMTSCASGVMGDDIEGAVKAVQPEIKGTIVPIRCEGFRSQISQTAFDAVWHAIVKYLVKEPKTKQKDLINLVAPFSVTWADRQEIRRLLGKMGLQVNIVPDFSTTEQFETLSEAVVSVTTCTSYGEYLLKALKEKYDIPYIENPLPLGIANTEAWLRKIAEYTGKEKEAEELIKEELSIVMPQVEALKKEFKGKKAKIMISGGQARMTFVPKFAAELGMEITTVNTLEINDILIDELKDVHDEIGVDYEVHASDMQPFEQSHILTRSKPELATVCPMAGLHKREASAVRLHSWRTDWTPFGNQMGFRGVVNYGYVMQRSFNNPSICKTLTDHTKKPYKKWWYSQKDPMYYLKKEETDAKHEHFNAPYEHLNVIHGEGIANGN